MVDFAVNHRVAPRLGLDRLIGLTKALGINSVEIRNDLPGVALSDGTSPDDVRRAAEAAGVRILSVNALQRFNDWTPRAPKKRGRWPRRPRRLAQRRWCSAR